MQKVDVFNKRSQELKLQLSSLLDYIQKLKPGAVGECNTIKTKTTAFMFWDVRLYSGFIQ